MTGGSGPKAEKNTPRRLRVDMRALLGKAVRSLRGIMRGLWQGRGGRRPASATMPVSAVSTERMLRANERLAEWRGVLGWTRAGLHLGDVASRHHWWPNPAERFSDAITSRYGSVPRGPLAVALPLAHVLRPMPGSSLTDSTGTFITAEAAIPPLRERTTEAEHPAGTTGPTRSLTPALQLFRVPLSSSVVQFEQMGHPASALEAETPLPVLGTVRPTALSSILSSQGRASTPVRVASTMGAVRSTEEMRVPGRMLVRGRMITPTGLSFPPGRSHDGEPLQQVSPAPGVQQPSAQVPLTAAPVSLWGPPQVQRAEAVASKPEQLAPAPRTRKPFQGVLSTKYSPPLIGRARSPASAQEARPMTSVVTGTPQTGVGRSRALGRVPSDGGPTRPLEVPRGPGAIPMQKKNRPLAQAVSAAAGVTVSERITVTGVLGHSSAPVAAFYPSVRQEARRRAVPREGTPARHWSELTGPAPQQTDGVPPQETGEGTASHHPGSTSRGREEMTVVAAHRLTGMHSLQPMRRTAMSLVTGVRSSRSERSGLQRRGIRRPTLRGLTVLGPPLRRSTEGQGLAWHGAGFAWPRSGGVDRIVQDLRVSSGDSLQLSREIGHGQPLAPRPRRAMETLLGKDLGAVRVHSEPAAARAAAMLKADAFTVGSDIFFSSGRMDFTTLSGMGLLGHEATHVVQQRGPQGLASTSRLEAQSRERDATGNELALRRVLGDRGSHITGPMDLALQPPGLSARGVTMVGTSPRPLPTQPLFMRPFSMSSVELSTAPADRETTAQAPVTGAPSVSEPAVTPQRDGGEREIDMSAVAQQVYDLIVRRLAVERERAGYL